MLLCPRLAPVAPQLAPSFGPTGGGSHPGVSDDRQQTILEEAINVTANGRE